MLKEILAHKRREVEAAKSEMPLPRMVAQAQHANQSNPPRDFFGAVTGSRFHPSLIAEVKKASPSKGLIRADFDPAAIGAAYAAAGAAALSVLTDRQYFQGDPLYLAQARKASGLPVLRKDFLIDSYQVYEARAMGADAVLLIAATLPLQKLRSMLDLAHQLGMAALVEVHTEDELDMVLQTPARLIGVNNRDLNTFVTDLAVTERLATRIPPDRFLVSESGIYTADDLRRLAGCGARAVLVGESLMRQPDVAAATTALLSGSQAGRKI